MKLCLWLLAGQGLGRAREGVVFKQGRFDWGSVLGLDPPARASLHGKCVLAERRTALVNSANFTEAAQTSNIEAGVLIIYEPFVKRIPEYFETLCQKMLKVCQLT